MIELTRVPKIENILINSELKPRAIDDSSKED